MLPDFNRLDYLFEYDPDTGFVRNKVYRSSNSFAGERVGCMGKNGYLIVRIDNKNYYLHRIIYKIMTGNDPLNEIDHINSIRHDNRWLNLREANRSQNACNSRKRKKSKHKNVFWNNTVGKYQVTVTFNKRTYHGGFFDDLDEAIEAAENLRDKLHGEYAKSI